MVTGRGAPGDLAAQCRRAAAVPTADALPDCGDWHQRGRHYGGFYDHEPLRHGERLFREQIEQFYKHDCWPTLALKF